MRKMIIGLLAACALSASAQVTIKPQITAGLEKTYHLAGFNKSVNQNGTDSLAYSVDQTFKVNTASPDSAVISMSYTNIKTSQGNTMPDMELLVHHPLLFSVNPDGTPRHLLNAKELIDAYKVDNSEIDDDYLNFLFSDNYLISNLSANSIIELFGKTLQNGKTTVKQDDDVVEVDYQLSADGKTIDADSKPSPSTEIRKHFVFGNDGWPTAYSLTTTIDMGEEMGKSVVGTKATLLEEQ